MQATPYEHATGSPDPPTALSTLATVITLSGLVVAIGCARVDLRSKSRVGRNDFGMNAKRIRTFADKLRGEIA